MKLRLTLLTAATLTALSFSAHAVEKGTIMIMVNSLDNPYYASEAKGASEKAQQLGYKTTILSHGEDVKKQNELIDTAIGKKVQGIILDNADSGNDSNLLIVFYVQIMPDDFVMQLHRF